MAFANKIWSTLFTVPYLGKHMRIIGFINNFLGYKNRTRLETAGYRNLSFCMVESLVILYLVCRCKDDQCYTLSIKHTLVSRGANRACLCVRYLSLSLSLTHEEKGVSVSLSILHESTKPFTRRDLYYIFRIVIPHQYGMVKSMFWILIKDFNTH